MLRIPAVYLLPLAVEASRKPVLTRVSWNEVKRSRFERLFSVAGSKDSKAS